MVLEKKLRAETLERETLKQWLFRTIKQMGFSPYASSFVLYKRTKWEFSMQQIERESWVIGMLDVPIPIKYSYTY